ncbi:MAG: response regulator [Acidobacteria bacterium]|nr:response regulator [Acidobacteriota bacterium]MCA1620661.1 response regulator [Acidobacteriota bacterium]
MAGQRVLVIEDQEDLAALYEQALTKEGYEVSKAYTGEEGFAVFEDNGADAVVLDMTLPEMHGVQTLQSIRKLNANVPVVVVTGETSGETRQQCERLGVQQYLSKPADYRDIVDALRGALSDPKTTTEEYQVVTLRLPSRIVKCLTAIDENIERAVELICEQKFK